MRVVFVYNGSESLGIASLSAYLKAHGHETFLVFDPAVFGGNRGRENPLLARLFEVRDVRTEAERARSLAESRLEEAEEERRGLSGMRDDLTRRGELLEAEAQRGLEERMRSVRGVLARMQRLLDQLPPQQRGELEVVVHELRDALEGASLTDRRKAFLDALKKGDLVYLPRYRRRAPVHKVDRDKREVAVKLGAMKLRVPFDEVTWYETL